ELTIATVEDDVVRTMIPINCVTTGGQMAADRPAEFSLLPQFVERIETARKGDVVLNLDFSVYGVEAAETAVNGQRALVLLGTVPEAQFKVQLSIPQSHWVGSILPSMSAPPICLFELPAENILFPDESSTAVAELKVANEYFRKGDYDKTVGHCRS